MHNKLQPLAAARAATFPNTLMPTRRGSLAYEKRPMTHTRIRNNCAPVVSFPYLTDDHDEENRSYTGSDDGRCQSNDVGIGSIM